MTREQLWSIFWETGAPEAWLLYRQEPAHGEASAGR